MTKKKDLIELLEILNLALHREFCFRRFGVLEWQDVLELEEERATKTQQLKYHKIYMR
jgi:hypothetical protein